MAAATTRRRRTGGFVSHSGDWQSGGSGVTMSWMSQVVESLDAAREAAARFAWRQAYEAYSGVDRKDLTPEDFESFGEAAWWSGKLDDAIRQRERSYKGFSAAEDKI